MILEVLQMAVAPSSTHAENKKPGVWFVHSVGGRVYSETFQHGHGCESRCDATGNAASNAWMSAAAENRTEHTHVYLSQAKPQASQARWVRV